jgi:HAD superfamily hydrolase (TIGR01484 family)
MNTQYIFDVDGTLANDGKPIDSAHIHWFEHWMAKRDVFLCTSNTYQNILPRLGRKILDQCVAVFTCNGNSIWRKGAEAKINNWRPSSDLISFLEDTIQNSTFKVRSGPNIELRTGMISFSIVGKTADDEERKRYHDWDNAVKERQNIVQQIKSRFSHLDASVTGKTSIDVYQKERDKSQILQYFRSNDSLYYFGNEPYGNDKAIMQAMYINSEKGYNVIVVTDPIDTFIKLRKISDDYLHTTKIFKEKK